MSDLINEEADLVNLTDDEFLAKHGKPKPPKDDDKPILDAINALTVIANEILAILKGSPPPIPPPSPPPIPPPSPPPIPTPSPPPIPPPSPPPVGSNLDVFGVQKIYDDAPAPFNHWAMTNGVNDPRFYEQTPKATSDPNWFTYQSLQQGRIEVRPQVGLVDTDIETFFYPNVIKKGYLHLPSNDQSGFGDWGDIEMTLAMRNVVQGSGSYEAHHEFVRGGFRQSTNSGKAGKDGKVIISCEAMSYHANIYHKSNRAKFEKDTLHTTGYTKSDPEFPGVMSGVDQKGGFIHKAIFYKVPDATQLGGFSMKLEQYVSTDGLAGKTFRKIADFLDHGQYGPTKGGVASQCGCPNENPIHSQSICAPGIRIDFMNSFEFGKFSIRSINPLKPIHAATDEEIAHNLVEEA